MTAAVGMDADMFAADSALAAAVLPSPNREARRDGRAIDLLVLHYTGMPDTTEALARLRDPASKVSCHYLVREDGGIVQLVPEAERAWHAGLSVWEDETDTNSRSIGIEIANSGHDHGYPDFPAAQIAAVIALGRDIVARRRLRAEHVLAHSDVAPARKLDPGEKFPWNRLADQGVGHFVPPQGPLPGPALAPGDHGEAVEELQALLALYGYGIEIDGRYDAPTAAVVAAFQRHFRPAHVDGVADPGTILTLRNLLAALPKQRG
ncbi:MAG TPA: N-acetylmuramoyl-L-alanine amidase [Hyphomicrobiales bacterium]|nr:N-acetylmuramoyl-L-alanine amidase [Hyphomicrobiales bacterium]